MPERFKEFFDRDTGVVFAWVGGTTMATIADINDAVQLAGGIVAFIIMAPKAWKVINDSIKKFRKRKH
jgi:hypothetical protein